MRFEDSRPVALPDFHLRRRVPTIVQFGVLLLISVAAMLAIRMALPSTLGFTLGATIVLAVIIGTVIWGLTRARDLLTYAEFQNTLFSSCINIGGLFCLIAGKDGTLSHADIGFRSLLPGFERQRDRMLEDALNLARISKEEKERIFQAIQEGGSAQLIVNLFDGDGKPRRVVLNVDPLKRPHGFALLRARPYIEQRSA